jgi:anti-sigma B factor antagonist
MQVQVVEDAEGTWLRVRGPVDYAEAQALVKAGRVLLQNGLSGPLRLDLAGVSFMDSSALGALLQLREQAESLGRVLELHNPSAPVLKILRVTNLDRVFSLHTAPDA